MFIVNVMYSFFTQIRSRQHVLLHKFNIDPRWDDKDISGTNDYKEVSTNEADYLSDAKH